MKKTNETNKVFAYTSIVDSTNQYCNSELRSIKSRQNDAKTNLERLESEEKSVKYGFQNKAHNLEQYSTFKIEQICPFMADIIGLSCGEEYTWGFLNYSVDLGNNSKNSININKVMFHPVNKNPLIYDIPYNQTFTMKYNNKKNEVTFFNTVTDLKSNTCGLKLTRENILEEIPLLGIFVDMLVEKRMVDKLDKVTNNDIKVVQYHFLTLYKDEVKKQYLESKRKKLK